MAGNRAFRRPAEVVEHVDTTGRTLRFLANIKLFSKKVGVCRDVGFLLLLLEFPGAFGTLDLLEVCDAGILQPGLARLDEIREHNRGQESDDGDHDHDLNEGKPLRGFCSLHRMSCARKASYKHLTCGIGGPSVAFIPTRASDHTLTLLFVHVNKDRLKRLEYVRITGLWKEPIFETSQEKLVRK